MPKKPIMPSTSYFWNCATGVVLLYGLSALPVWAATSVTSGTTIVFDSTNQAADGGFGGGGGGIGGGGGGGGFGGGGGYGGGGGGVSGGGGGGGGLPISSGPNATGGLTGGFGGWGGGGAFGGGGDSYTQAFPPHSPEGGGLTGGNLGIGGGTAGAGQGGSGFGGGGGSQAGGGGGGITSGGNGFTNTTITSNGNYGFGGELGVSTTDLGISGSLTRSTDNTFSVSGTGVLDIFGGSGGGGGGATAGHNSSQLSVNISEQTGGTINLLGGVGGGGGAAIIAKGGDGQGSIANLSGDISGGTFNVFGGAGGGGNSVGIQGMAGGNGTGAILNGNGHNMNGILNVYAGANGQASQAVGGAIGAGGVGNGGTVNNITIGSSGVMNMYAGTNAAAPNTGALYGGSGPIANNITNQGILHMNAGSLTGVYTQSGNGILNLNGGNTSGLTSSSFSGGQINAANSTNFTFNNSQFTGGNVTTNNGTTGNLTFTDANVSGANVNLGTNVTMNGNTSISSGSLTVGTNSTVSGNYNQSGTGILTLAGGTYNAAGTFSGGGIVLASGQPNYTLGGSIFNGSTVTTSATGTGGLVIDNANIGSTGNLVIGDQVTLSNTTLTQGAVSLVSGGTLGTGYVQNNGTLNLASSDTFNANNATFNGGNINAAASAATLANATINSGTVNTNTLGGTNALTLTNTTIASGGGLNVEQNVTLQNSNNAGVVNVNSGGIIQTTSNTGAVNLNAGSTLGAGYTQSAGSLNFNDSSVTASNGGTFSGGSVNAATGSTITFANANFDGGNVATNTSGNMGNLTFADANINNALLTVGTNVFFTDTLAVINGTLNLNNDGALNGVTSSTLDNSIINAYIGDNTLASATITGALTTQVASGASLSIADTSLSATANYTNNGADVTLTNFDAGALYTQDGGTLIVATSDLASASAGAITIGGGSLTNSGGAQTVSGVAFVNSPQGLPNATIIGESSTAKLTLDTFTVDGTTLKAKENTILKSATVQNNGILSVEDGSLIDGNTHLQSGGMLQINGGSFLTDPGAPTTVTLASLTGNDGNILLRTNFDTRMGDHFTINGNSSGNHTLIVKATGYGTDMPLLNDRIGAGITQNANFVLQSGTNTFLEDDGAYLARSVLSSDDQTNFRVWSLSRFINGYSATALSAATAPAASLNQVLVGMNELSKRLGELRNDKDDAASGLWMRSYVRKGSVDTLTKIDLTTFGMEAGYDHRLAVDIPGRLYLGVMSGGLWSDNIKMHQNYAKNGRGQGKAPSVGAYATWINDNGWFVDGTIRHFWSELDLTSYQYNGTAVHYKPKTRNFGASVEAGKRLNFGDNNQWIAEPRLELTSVWTSSDKLTTSSGSKVNYKSSQSLQGTAGINIGYKGEILEPYLKFALTHEFDGKADTIFEGTKLTSKMNGARAIMGGGLNAKLTDNSAFFMDATWENGKHIKNVGANVGLRYTW